MVALLDGDGWQIMTHAIGDAAVRMTLDAYEAAANPTTVERTAGQLWVIDEKRVRIRE